MPTTSSSPDEHDDLKRTAASLQSGESGRPTLFLGDISEDKRIAASGFNFDIWYEKEGWKGRWGFDPEANPRTASVLAPILKTIALAEKAIREMAAQIHPNDRAARKLYIESILEDAEDDDEQVWAANLMEELGALKKRHDLGLRERYRGERDSIKIEVEAEAEEDDGDPQYPEE